MEVVGERPERKEAQIKLETEEQPPGGFPRFEKSSHSSLDGPGDDRGTNQKLEALVTVQREERRIQ